MTERGETESIQSSDSHDGIKEYNPMDLEQQDEVENLSQHLSQILSTPQGVEKIETLARVLSTKTKAELEKFEISEDNFDLRILQQFDLLGY
ncbi:unnamed protein product [Ambrosiozyma monospora]|uniref:Unnamed protein product n=1 Tax=Ambrosiozyma monospora TaxID=43982 RepID=A0ACB5TWD8_AMBMO|nr:unnamed protein product [Ambrosiozyma monospora]